MATDLGNVAGAAKDWLPIEAHEAPPCPVCQGVDFEPLFSTQDHEYGLPGTFHVGRCTGCGLMQQTPRPAFSDILRYYRSDYASYQEVDENGLVSRLKQAAINWPRLRAYRRLLPHGGAVLDVGCGSGTLLRMLRDNTDWTLKGLEPVADAAAAGRATGLDIVASTLEEARFPDASFDLVLLNHVLEHVPDPVSTLVELTRILKPGGHLCGEVPTPRCFERALFGPYWAGYHLPRHLYFFEKRHLERMFSNAGLEVVSIAGKPQPANVLVSCSNMLKDRWPAAARRGLFSENSFVWLATSTPIALAAHFAGSSASLRFVCRRTATHH